MSDLLKNLAKSRDAAFSGDAQKIKSFTTLGVSLEDLKTKTPQKLFEQIARRIARL